MLRLFLGLFFTFAFFTAWPDNYERSIQWSESSDTHGIESLNQLSFEGAETLDHTGIPYWLESFSVDPKVYSITLENTEYEPVNLSEKLIPAEIGSELYYSSEIGVSAGQSRLYLKVLPFVRVNDQLLRLTQFTVVLNESEPGLKSALAPWPWKSNSVLASGKWVKIKVKSKGIYKISYDQLKTWGFSLPEQVVLYGGGGLMLPVLNKDIRFDDLPLYPILRGKDNSNKDCIFFYATGSTGSWLDTATGQYFPQQNYYSAETYFFLSDQGTAKQIVKSTELTEVAGRKINSFPNYAYSEKELVNLIHSGSQWFGEQFSNGSSQTINLVLENPDLTKSVKLGVSAAAKSTAASYLDVTLNGKSLSRINFQSVSGDVTSNYADLKKSDYTELVSTKNLQVRMTYGATNSSSDAWLDYLSVNYESILNFSSDVYFFRGTGASGQIAVSEFVLNGASASVRILDVTDFLNTSEVPATFSENQLKFKSNSGTVREYVAFNMSGTLPVPELVGTVANQNLHAGEVPQMIIVAPLTLLKAANELASFRRSYDQMKVTVVTPEMVYNEFSGGLPDAAGLRNYFRMCYDRSVNLGNSGFKYVLLFGDGNYDNRNILGKNSNLIPTYQSENSISPVGSFVSDDFYGFMDENEGGYSGIIDIGVGRIPAKTLAEANVVVNKIKNYHQKESMGNWRNVVTFIGDDEDNSTHMDQAETLAKLVNKSYPAFAVDKIYFDAYKQLSTPSGEKYPDVTAAIHSRVKNGTLIMNYTGHANEKNLADENVLDIGGINTWTNYNKLAVFVTATCEFSRFDGDVASAGEYILFNPLGGGVGLFSTTRLVYSGANFVLNREFFKNIFEKDSDGQQLRLGDVMRLAKASANTGINQLNFSLLADPSMRLANPANQILTTSINGHDVSQKTDTIRTLTTVTVKGFVADPKGRKLSSFNGEIIPTVYDKAVQAQTLGNGGELPMSYTVQNNIIFKGLASVKNGEFEFSFFVPKDISYKLDKGKILYYAYNETIDAQGYFDGFYIGGASNATIKDTDGPLVDLFMNTESFKDGGKVSASSVLIANISDASGINTAGTGIGHDITAVLDGDYSSLMVLNDFFQADKDSYKSGKIVFPLSDLAEGEHVLTLKVWDVLNNSTEKTIRFTVKDDFRIDEVSCYPNPMQTETRFVFSHNQPDETMDVNLEIFLTSGTRIDMIKSTVASIGTESVPLVWAPDERNIRMRAGVYIYRITATTKDGKSTNGSGRLLYVYP